MYYYFFDFLQGKARIQIEIYKKLVHCRDSADIESKTDMHMTSKLSIWRTISKFRRPTEQNMNENYIVYKQFVLHQLGNKCKRSISALIYQLIILNIISTPTESNTHTYI